MKKIKDEDTLKKHFDLEMLFKEIIFNRLTCKDVEEIYNIDKRFMSFLNKTYNLGINPRWAQQRNKYKEKGLTKEKLYQLYMVERKSLRYISNIYSMNKSTVKQALDFFNICEKEDIRPFNYDEYYSSRRKYDKDNRRDREYRLVIEKHLGKQLDEKEVVHHIDLDRSNNDIDNLFLFENGDIHSSYHGYIRFHDYISPQEYLDTIYVNYTNTVKNRDWLYDQYINNRRSIKSISEETGISRVCITTQLKRYGIFQLREKSVNQYN